MRTVLLLLSFLFLTFSSAEAIAQDQAGHIESSLLASVDTAVPGQSFEAAIHLIMDDEWHTYWKNPGDSGIPVSAAWTKPENVEISDLEWPTPALHRTEGIVDFSYSGTATLLTTITVPTDFNASEFVLTADLTMLVCKEICIPENDTVQLVLPVGENAAPANQGLFAEARASLPLDYSGTASYNEAHGSFILALDPAPENFEKAENIQFFPVEWGIILNGTIPETYVENGVATISIARDTRELSEIDNMEGVLKYESMGKNYAYQFTSGYSDTIEVPAINTFSQSGNGFTPPPQDTATGALPDTDLQQGEGSADINYIQALLFAFIGGLILNLMPCVFPILSMKALSFTKLSAKERKHAAIHGLLYTAGVILSMLVFAAIISGLHAGGSKIGWGFQLQNPLIVALLFWLFFIIGLNLLGLFDVAGSFSNIGNRFRSKNGYRNDFLTGVLVVIVATPCTAPFMAAAVGYALVHPPLITFSVFTGLGFGLALPFLLLSVSPALQKYMPKPGPWMVVFKQIIAFPMFLACIWLAWVITLQTGADGIAATLFVTTLIAFFIWFSKITSGLTYIVIALLCLVGLYKGIDVIHKADMAIEERMESRKHAGATDFTPEALETALASKNPVFVNMTAAWCITCKVNERTTIKNQHVQDFMSENNVEYIVGDWTRFDENITDYLAQFKRSGVPIYVFYPSPDDQNIRPDPIVLPQILTPDLVIETMQTNL